MKKARHGGIEAVDLVVFDLDGTLVDGREDISRAVNHGILEVGGESRPISEIIPHIGRPLNQIFQDLLPAQLRGLADRAAEIYREYFFDHCADTSTLYPGVAQCLEALRCVPRAVATTKRTFMAAEVLRAMGIAHHFALVQGSEDIPQKPDPAVLTRVLAKLGKPACRSWIVGDTVFDIQAGKAAGMRTCAVTYGIGLAGDLSREAPDLLLDSLEDLPAAIGVL